MAYHKNKVRRSSAFASKRYTSLVPAVLEKHEQKALDAREERERRKRKKQRAAERLSVDDLMKQIQTLQTEQQEVVNVPRFMDIDFTREDTPIYDENDIQNRLSSILGNRDEKDAQDTLKYVVDELDKLKVSLEEVRDIVIMKTSRRHMEWAFHSARFSSTVEGTWQPDGSDRAKRKSPRSGYSERMLQSSSFYTLYDDFSESTDQKPNIVEISDSELSHNSQLVPIK